MFRRFKGTVTLSGAISLTGAVSLASAVSLGACSGDAVYVAERTPAAAAEVCDSTSNANGSEPCFIDPGLDEKSPQLFLEKSSARERAPRWIYPLADSVHPPNLQLLSFHFERGSAAHEVFELAVRGKNATRVLYLPCFGAGRLGCVYQAPEKFWRDTATIFAGETVRLELRAAGSSGPSEAAVEEITIAPAPVLGGLYFWSADLRGLYRLVIGSRQAVPYIAPRTSENPDACSGCHSVSRDGGTVAFTRGQAEEAEDIYDNAAFNGYLNVSGVLTPNEPFIAPRPGAESDSAMMALSSNGSRVVSAFDYILRLRDVESGDEIDTFVGQSGKSAFFPEWSPSDDALVVTLSSKPDSEIAVRSGSIATIEMGENGFGSVTEIVPEEPGTAHYYPTWSPDGEWIAFVSGPGGPADVDKSYYQPESRLRLVRRSGGPVYEMKNATGRGDQTATWPKFAPFQQCPDASDSCASGERIFFLTFSSRRDFGLRLTSADGASAVSQLWLSAVDLRRLQGDAADPSLPPLWLPYQSTETPNHLGFWTEALRCNDRLPCDRYDRCDEDGKCRVVIR